MTFKKTLLLITLVFTVKSALSASSVSVNVSRNKDDKTSITSEAVFMVDSSNYHQATLWRSPKGAVCAVDLWGKPDELEGSFTCQAKNQYKAQILFSCNKHTSMENGAYMFFGHASERAENGNFFVWCKKNS